MRKKATKVSLVGGKGNKWTVFYGKKKVFFGKKKLHL
jgi:hypothetical protein